MRCNLLYIHENNIKSKISSNYKNLKQVLEKFYETNYKTFRQDMENIMFEDGQIVDFIRAAEVVNNYYNEALVFQQNHNIDTRSKFLSTIYEELSVYLFKDNSAIKNGPFGIFNKRIYAGLKFVNDGNISVVNKDVDFCIGKEIDLKIDNSNMRIILPVVCVEVKTYLDATMFGEVKSSSHAIRSATPNSKAFVLMGHKELADEHIIAARQDSTLTEMFVLRGDKSSPIDGNVLFEYWDEITNAIDEIYAQDTIGTPGRLLKPSIR